MRRSGVVGAQVGQQQQLHSGPPRKATTADVRAQRAAQAAAEADAAVAASKFYRPTKEERIATLYSDRSLFCLESENPVRMFCIRVTESKYFDLLSLLVIIVNIGFLAAQDPLKGPSEGRNKVVEWADIYFNSFYTAEMLLKIVSSGFLLHGTSYLRDHWNQFDFVIVIVGWVTILGADMSGAAALRAFRVMRALKTIKGLAGMRLLILSVIASIPALGNVMALYVFMFVIFGITGVQLWEGVLNYRCFVPGTTEPALPLDRLCSTTPGGRHCPVEQDCLDSGQAPNYGITSFNHMGTATLTLFQCITLEGWVDIMYNLQDASTFFVFIYFVVLIVFGSFFVVNLALAVMYAKFSSYTTMFRDQEEQKREARRLRRLALACEQDAIDEASGSSPGGRRKATSQSHLAGRRSPSVKRKGSSNALPRSPSTMALTKATSPPGSPPTSPAAARRVLMQNVPLREETGHSQNRLAASLRVVVESPLFQRFIIACIIFNTIVLAIDHHNMSDGLRQFSMVANLVFSCIFIVELVFKMIGLGVREYFADGFNGFDFLVVMLSIGEFFILGASGGGVFSVFRAFRLLRIFRLARSWDNLRTLIDVTIASLPHLFNCLLLMALFLTVFAVIGMQLFGGKMDFDDGLPRHNFDTFWWSVVNVFQVMTGENWNEVMYDGVRATHWLASIYFVILVLAGNYIILTLVQVIMLEKFEAVVTLDQRRKKVDEKPPASVFFTAAENEVPGRDSVGGGMVEMQDMSGKATGGDAAAGASVLSPPTTPAGKVAKPLQTANGSPPPGKKVKPKVEDVVCGVSLWILKADNKLRLAIARFILHPAFETFIIAMICVSSIILLLDHPGIEEGSAFRKFIWSAEIFFIVLFTLEMAIKVLVFGFVLHKGAYLRSNAWNKLDFFVVLVSLATIVLPFNVGFIRALRALRPLRLVGRSSGMKVVVKSISKSAPSIFNVLVLCLLFWLIFAILGVQFFGGKFYSCTDPRVPLRVACDGQFVEENFDEFGNVFESIQKRKWLPHPEWSFDNVIRASLVLFEVATLERWPSIMHLSVDAVSTDHVPERDHNPMVALYYIMFIMICGFFVLNLFVGVVIDNFNRVKDKYDGSAFLTKSQRDWVAMQKIMMRHRPRRVYNMPQGSGAFNDVRRLAFEVIMTRTADMVIIGCILLNTVFLMLQHYNQPDSLTEVLFAANIFFTTVFTIEALLKLMALGFKQYWYDRWNRFDLFIVVISLAGLAFSVGSGASALRTLRVFRVFKIIKSAKGLNYLFVSLIYALPTLSNVGSLLLLIFFIYAVAGVSLFGKVQHGEFLNDFANFEHSGIAMLTLFRMITGESWNGIMHDATVQPPRCSGDSCGVRFGNFYFLSFELIVFFVLANLFIAVVIEAFNDLTQEDDVTLRGEDFSMFTTIWSKYDRRHTYYILPGQLPELIKDLPEPLGVAPGDQRRLDRLLLELNEIPLYNDRVFYKDVLLALCRRVVDVDDLPENIKVAEELEKKWTRKYKGPTGGLPEYTVAQLMAVRRIERHWVAFAKRNNLERRRERLKAPLKQKFRQSWNRLSTWIKGPKRSSGSKPKQPQPTGSMADTTGNLRVLALMADAADGGDPAAASGRMANRRSSLQPSDMSAFVSGGEDADPLPGKGKGKGKGRARRNSLAFHSAIVPHMSKQELEDHRRGYRIIVPSADDDEAKEKPLAKRDETDDAADARAVDPGAIEIQVPEEDVSA